MLIYQALGQIEQYYRKPSLDKWRQVAAFCCSAIAGEEQERISKLCGTYTAEVEAAGTTNSTQSATGMYGNMGTSTNVALQAANLIQPSEVGQLRQDAQLLFFLGEAPLYCGKAVWFRRPEWIGDKPVKKKKAFPSLTMPKKQTTQTPYDWAKGRSYSPLWFMNDEERTIERVRY